MAERRPNPDAPPDREGALGSKDVRALLVGGALVVLLYLGLTINDALRDGSASTAVSPREEPAQATLVVVGLEVKPTKADGSRWDVGLRGLPDPRVLVVNQTTKERRRTRKVDDSLTATYQTPTVRVREGDEVYLRVDDVDLAFDDLVGEHRFRVTRDMIRGPNRTLDLAFGQVKSLTLRFDR
jgi:hypothetical protein